MENSALELYRLDGQNQSSVIMQDCQSLGASSATAELYAYTCKALNKARLRVLEAGSGSGVLSILLAQANPDWELCGIEIQPHLCALAQANAASLNLDISFLEADLRLYAGNPADLIVSNPPWQKLGCGIISPNPQRAICRSELLCSMPDLLEFVWCNLKPLGEAILLYPPSRGKELLSLAVEYGFKVESSLPHSKSCQIFHLYKG